MERPLWECNCFLLEKLMSSLRKLRTIRGYPSQTFHLGEGVVKKVIFLSGVTQWKLFPGVFRPPTTSFTTARRVDISWKVLSTWQLYKTNVIINNTPNIPNGSLAETFLTMEDFRKLWFAFRNQYFQLFILNWNFQYYVDGLPLWIRSTFNLIRMLLISVI